jgi:hypothetical protein
MNRSIFQKRRRKMMALTPLKSTGWNWCAHLRSGCTIISACGVTTREHVMKNMTLGGGDAAYGYWEYQQ